VRLSDRNYLVLGWYSLCHPVLNTLTLGKPCPIISFWLSISLWLSAIKFWLWLFDDIPKSRQFLYYKWPQMQWLVISSNDTFGTQWLMQWAGSIRQYKWKLAFWLNGVQCTSSALPAGSCQPGQPMKAIHSLLSHLSSVFNESYYYNQLMAAESQLMAIQCQLWKHKWLYKLQKLKAQLVARLAMHLP